ncbi:MAG: hypothetical protein ACD_28C00016G0009 [uncultured bacterium]|nr:MAG: hypothetical protein ACD_28C00016G0009 [uncultured bacterium]
MKKNRSAEMTPWKEKLPGVSRERAEKLVEHQLRRQVMEGVSKQLNAQSHRKKKESKNEDVKKNIESNALNDSKKLWNLVKMRLDSIWDIIKNPLQS